LYGKRISGQTVEEFKYGQFGSWIYQARVQIEHWPQHKITLGKQRMWNSKIRAI
jgi:hypothetical protein